MTTRTAKGKYVDFNHFMAQEGDAVAIGNAGLNARGDKVDRNGKIVTPIAQVMEEYNRSKASAAKAVPISALTSEVFATPAEAMKTVDDERKKTAASKRKISESDE